MTTDPIWGMNSAVKEMLKKPGLYAVSGNPYFMPFSYVHVGEDGVCHQLRVVHTDNEAEKVVVDRDGVLSPEGWHINTFVQGPANPAKWCFVS